MHRLSYSTRKNTETLDRFTAFMESDRIKDTQASSLSYNNNVIMENIVQEIVVSGVCRSQNSFYLQIWLGEKYKHSI